MTCWRKAAIFFSLHLSLKSFPSPLHPPIPAFHKYLMNLQLLSGSEDKIMDFTSIVPRCFNVTSDNHSISSKRHRELMGHKGKTVKKKKKKASFHFSLSKYVINCPTYKQWLGTIYISCQISPNHKQINKNLYSL